MNELMWSLFGPMDWQDALFSTFMLLGIALFSVLAARAEARMWHAIGRFNGERRALQRRITLGKSRLY